MNGIKTEPFIDLTGVKTEPGLSTWTGIKSEPTQPSLTFKSEPNAAQYRAQLQMHKHYDNLSGILPGPSGRTTQRAPDQNSNWPKVPGISPDVVNQIDRLANIEGYLQNCTFLAKPYIFIKCTVMQEMYGFARC